MCSDVVQLFFVNPGSGFVRASGFVHHWNSTRGQILINPRIKDPTDKKRRRAISATFQNSVSNVRANCATNKEVV